jgi:hypothetical protein
MQISTASPISSSVVKPCIFVQTPTASLISSVIVIALGTAIAGYGELNISIIGIIIQVISETAEAGRLIMTQTLLQGSSFHPIEGLMYLAPASVVWMALFAGFFEVPAIVKSGALRIVFENPGLFAIAASMGFGVMALAMFTIQLCGSLTLKVCALMDLLSGGRIPNNSQILARYPPQKGLTKAVGKRARLQSLCVQGITARH